MKEGAHLKWLALAFAVITAVFVGSAYVTYSAVSRIDDEIADLRKNSLPSVAHLSAARSDVQRVRLLADKLTLVPGGSVVEDLQAIRALRASVDARLAAYEGTAWYPGEQEIYDGRVRPGLARLDEAIAHLERSVRAPLLAQRAAADFEVDSAAGDLDEALSEDLELNHSQSSAATERILDERRRDDKLALILTATAAGVAALLAVCTLQVSRYASRLSRERLDFERRRAAELEMFAARVGHDLLSPLSAATLSLTTIGRAHPDAATGVALARAQRALERSRAIVQSIYDFSRAGARPQEGAGASFRDSLKGVIDEVQGPAVEVEPFDDVEIACAPGVLDTVFSNLLHNAARCMKQSPVQGIMVRSSVRGGMARIEVEDTGPGVPEELRKTIFDPYVRGPGATQGGLGLGLATVKRLVEGHGGSVGVQGGAQGGAVFWFELPVVRRGGGALASALARPATR
jgi:signal transduction histidine kinase